MCRNKSKIMIQSIFLSFLCQRIHMGNFQKIKKINKSQPSRCLPLSSFCLVCVVASTATSSCHPSALTVNFTSANPNWHWKYRFIDFFPEIYWLIFSFALVLRKGFLSTKTQKSSEKKLTNKAYRAGTFVPFGRRITAKFGWTGLCGRERAWTPINSITEKNWIR